MLSSTTQLETPYRFRINKKTPPARPMDAWPDPYEEYIHKEAAAAVIRW